MGITIKESIVLLTGANRGIGKAILEQLIDQGASKVYACARNTDSLKPLIEGKADKIIPLELDITNETHIQQAASQAGDVNIVINNAGILNYTHLYNLWRCIAFEPLTPNPMPYYRLYPADQCLLHWIITNERSLPFLSRWLS